MFSHKIRPKIIVVFGSMGTGKSFIAKELTKYLGLPDNAHLEGDDVLNSPELADLKDKVARNEDLTEADVARIVPALIKLIEQRLTDHSTLVVSQALYFNADRKKILDKFGGYENVAFLWVRAPDPIHIDNLYTREYERYLKDKPKTISNKMNAFGNGIKALAVNLGYSVYFENPENEFTFSSSVKNFFKAERGSTPVKAISYFNLGIGEMKLQFDELPLAARKNIKKEIADEKHLAGVAKP